MKDVGISVPPGSYISCTSVCTYLCNMWDLC